MEKQTTLHAFKKAIGNGRVKVIVPEGVFITKGICLPSWTFSWVQENGKQRLSCMIVQQKEQD